MRWRIRLAEIGQKVVAAARGGGKKRSFGVRDLGM